ncbi:MAG: threonine-phosphate decarboxylase [Cyanobacteria bacterium J083]|nr:MAG: threonine-phosphate decarboxylase [Cyanobacteria bacterium J083]
MREKPVHGGNLTWAATIADCPASEILDFSASINPLGPPQSALRAITQGIKQLTAYPDPNYWHLKQTIAHWHQIPPNWVLPGNGAAELLTWAGRELAKKKVTYLLTPSFADYWRCLTTFGAKIAGYRLNLDSQPIPFPLDLDAKGDYTQSGLIINNPHNPTGQLWEKTEIRSYLDKFALVVVDEAFMDFLPTSQTESLIADIQQRDNLIILRSLTKFFSLPGLRIGYAISQPRRLEAWQKWRDPWAVNTLAVLAAEAAIQDQKFQTSTWRWLTTAKSDLYQRLRAIPGLQPRWGAANFLLVKTNVASDLLQLELLKRHKILIRDCSTFPQLGNKYFRLAIRSSQENHRLLSALEQVIPHLKH